MTMPRKKTYGRTVNGELITERFIEEAVQRAEAGYDVDEMLSRDAEPKPAAASDAHVRTSPPQRPRRRQ